MTLLYEEVVAKLTQFMQKGIYMPGTRLPSIRELAERLNCSRNTIIRAYEELERRDLIFSVAKSGYYMVERPDNPADKEWEPAARGIDMASASPDERVMPYEDFRHCLNRAIDLYRDSLFGYGHKEGLPSLRQLLAKRLYEDQIFVSPEQICIVSGTQQAIHLLCGMSFPNGKVRILLEQPTYTGSVRAAGLQGVTAIGISRTEEGIDLAELEQHFRNNDIKFFYTTPRFHNPSGACYTMEMKTAIVNLARTYGVYILEDDYLGDLDDRPRHDSMAAVDRCGQVILLRSFSKTVLPGIRLGAVILPHSLVGLMQEHKSAADGGTSALNQGALEIFLKSGMYDRHLRQIRVLYKERMAALRNACQRLLPPEIKFQVGDNGIFAIVELPEGLSSVALAARLDRLGLAVTPGRSMRLPGYPGPDFIRLSIIRADADEAEQGIRLLATELNHACKQRTARRVIDDHA